MDASDHGFVVEAHDAVVSTQHLARSHARAGRTRLVVTAVAQTGGHGRLERTWASPAGNLYASTVLDVHLPPALVPTVSLAVALALAEAIEGLGGRPRLKWPNDVLLDGKKVAGILLEHEAGRIVVGTGVNVAVAPPEVPDATSLAAAGVTTTPAELLVSFLARLDEWIKVLERDGFARVREAWLARAAGLGGLLRVETGARTLHGRHGGLDGTGALVLETAEGPEAIAAGEVHLVRPGEGG